MRDSHPKTIDMDYLPDDIDDYTIIRVKGVRYYPEFQCTRKPSTRYVREDEYWGEYETENI